MSIEQRLEQVERQTKRLRIAVVVLATALCGVVSMAAKGNDIGYYKKIFAEEIIVRDPSANNPQPIWLLPVGEGGMIVVSDDSKSSVSMVALDHQSSGVIRVHNKTGEEIITLQADEYGNGEVGAWNRKGKGRVWRSQ
jgi:hypothetical protein